MDESDIEQATSLVTHTVKWFWDDEGNDTISVEKIQDYVVQKQHLNL